MLSLGANHVGKSTPWTSPGGPVLLMFLIPLETCCSFLLMLVLSHSVSSYHFSRHLTGFQKWNLFSLYHKLELLCNFSFLDNQWSWFSRFKCHSCPCYSFFLCGKYPSGLDMGVCCYCQVIHEASIRWLSDVTRSLWPSCFSLSSFNDHIHSHHE